MNVLAISLVNPAGLWALALAVPVLLLHILRPRRPQAEVPSVLLWRAVEAPVSAARPWQKLRWSALLALQLLAVGLLALALARPVRATKAPLSAHTVFVIDASGSMAAKDGEPDRMGSARAQARKLRGQLPAGGVASVVVASAEPEVLLSSSADRGAFDAALNSVTVLPGPARWQDAFNLAASLETPGKPIGIVLLSDGGLDRQEQRAIPAGTAYRKIGSRATNRAITVFNVEPRNGGLSAHVTVRNTGGSKARQRLRVDVDGHTQATINLELPTGKAVDRTIAIPAGDRIVAFLDGDDLLDADNRAYAVGAPTRPLRVLVAGPDDPFLDNVLASIAGVSVQRAADGRPAPGFDLAIYNGVTVPASPGAPFLAIAPTAGSPGVTLRGRIEQPSLTTVSNDPLLAGLDLSEVAIAEAQDLAAPDADVLVAAEGTPLLLRGADDGHRYAYLGFRLSDSNLPLQVAFPLLMDRLVHDLAGGAPGTAAVTVGSPLPVDAAESVTVVRPRNGGVVRRPAGGSAPLADRTGFWEVRQPGRPNRLVAVNPDPRESNLAPASALPIALRPPIPGQPRPSGQRSLLTYLIAALLALLLAEWLVARRRIGVPRRQWRVAIVARTLIVALLLGSLVGLTWSRKDKSLAVLFAIDGSDSLGSDGREQALDFVRTSLDNQPKGAKAGVVVFGGDARVESLVAKGVSLDNPSVQIDRAHTNAAGALRLAPALLPPTARRRVVLLSDGRFTDGDARSEAQRLRDAGIPVDVHIIAPARAEDVAVTSVEVPSRLEQGDAFSVRSVVRATTATRAVVRIRRDDSSGRHVDVATRTVNLKAGDNVIDVPDAAEHSGVARYRVQVDAPGDPREENDVAYSAAAVNGPPKLLVVEGSPGEATTLVAALRATGVQSDVIAAGALPTVERLSEYRATVLVDVEARSLSPDQLRAISEATKELGRGLVVIGGEHAYALGGYGGTPLEDLLPVASEVTDPLKRKSVAQVLAIDTSGSMGACHCAGGQGFGGRLQGGVNKTEIARTAAARAIATMAKDDQIGVLAFNTRQRWAIDMQTVPAADIVQRGLAGLTARGNTNLTTPLLVAGDKLRNTKANLKHIVLFTDGFTSQDALAGLASQAQSLHDEGITVSVVATGEGAAQELSAVAAAGHGRFYPGTDLLEIPEIIVQETVLASRTFINEGEFRPVVTGTAAPVRGLDASPALLGYVATTAKATSETWLRIGGQRDPLLSSWRVGLGRVTAWTSDASERWSQRWASWDGYSAFWAGIIKHTFPGEEGAVVRTEVRGDKLLVKVEGDGAWPDGATGSLQLAGPDGVSRRVPLDRTGSDTLSAALDAPVAGTYAVGADIRKSDGSSLARASGLATRSYAAEYLPGAADRKTMQAISAITRGRGDIESAAAFDPTGLRGGSAKRALRNWLLLLAALLWPIDIALRRLTRRRAGAAHAARAGTLATRLRGVSAAVRSKLSIDGAPPLGASGGRGSAPAGRSAPSAAPAGGPAARIGPRTAPLSAARIGPRTAPLSAPAGSRTGSPNGSGANGDTRPATDLVTIGPSPGRTGPAGGTSAVAVAERPASKSANLERMLAAKRARAAKSAPETGDASKAGIPGEGDKASGAH